MVHFYFERTMEIFTFETQACFPFFKLFATKLINGLKIKILRKASVPEGWTQT